MVLCSHSIISACQPKANLEVPYVTPLVANTSQGYRLLSKLWSNRQAHKASTRLGTSSSYTPDVCTHLPLCI